MCLRIIISMVQINSDHFSIDRIKNSVFCPVM